ncbi:MAG: hypothetical protein JXR64_01350, partial [Spirochaetales bacterium]|nr:hypothetical protein [Spirochaetales bacterium]
MSKTNKDYAGEDYVYALLTSESMGTNVFYSDNYNDENCAKYVFMNNGAKSSDIEVSGVGYPIGFNFMYNGQEFNRVGISSNFYIKLGKANNEVFSMYNDTIPGGIFKLGNDSLRSNIIGLFQLDPNLFSNYRANIRYQLVGYPGKRVFVVKYIYVNEDVWSNIRYIFLNEWKNEVEFWFGLTKTKPSSTYPVYCGIRGDNNKTTNLNIRKIIYGDNTWLTSIDGDSLSYCDYNSSCLPTNIAYKFTPVVSNILHSPTAFFKFRSWDSIPNYIGLTGSTNTTGYVFANGATEIPTNVTISWSPEYTSSTNYYKIYFGTDSLDMNLLADSLTATEYKLPVLAEGITYYYKIIAFNASGIADPCMGSFTTTNNLIYCTPSWACNSFVESITLNTLLYTYPGTDDLRRELPFEAPYTTTLQRDSSYLFSITALSTAPCFGTCCWIDFNQDGEFDISTEQFDENSDITVPHDAILGTTKMRVGKILCTSPGSSFIPCSYNVQYQDFTITIAPNDDCTNFSFTADLSNPSCFGENTGEIQLNLSGGTLPYTIQWQKDGTTLSASGETLSNCTRGTY